MNFIHIVFYFFFSFSFSFLMFLFPSDIWPIACMERKGERKKGDIRTIVSLLLRGLITIYLMRPNNAISTNFEARLVQ